MIDGILERTVVLGSHTDIQVMKAETLTRLVVIRERVRKRLREEREGEIVVKLSWEIWAMMSLLTEQGMESPGRIREVVKGLLELKDLVSSEVMMVLTLPQPVDCQWEEHLQISQYLELIDQEGKYYPTLLEHQTEH